MTAGRARLLPAVFFIAERQAHRVRPLGLQRKTAVLLAPAAWRLDVRPLGLPRGHSRSVPRIALLRRMIHRVSVEAASFKKLSPMETLMYAARLYSLEPAHARHEIVSILNTLGIKTERIYQPLEKMSRGMQQKVAIARALLTSPILLLLDEPTTGLDPRSKKDVQEFILRVREQHEATIVLTSHDMDEADRLCDRIAFIDNGRLVREDTPLGLKRDYARRHAMDTALPSLEDVFLEVVGRSLSDDDAEDDEEAKEAQEASA